MNCPKLIHQLKIPTRDHFPGRVQFQFIAFHSAKKTFFPVRTDRDEIYPDRTVIVVWQTDRTAMWPQKPSLNITKKACSPKELYEDSAKISQQFFRTANMDSAGDHAGSPLPIEKIMTGVGAALCGCPPIRSKPTDFGINNAINAANVFGC
jgi:hypothetical protein